MTDNEIIKALELCANRTIHSCKFCPCNSGIECNKKLNEGTLDLINRQKAEIEKLKNTDFQVEVSSRLEKEIRAEAIKEFSEKLKQQAFECGVSFGFGKEHYTKAVAVFDIEKLVEEMTEVKNNA